MENLFEKYEEANKEVNREATEETERQKEIKEIIGNTFDPLCVNIKKGIYKVSDKKKLTDREIETLCYRLYSYSREAIADKLGIAPCTVKKHLAEIHVKLGVDSKYNLMERVEEYADKKDPKQKNKMRK